MREEIVAKRYAKGLFESLTAEETFDRVRDELAGFVELLRREEDLSGYLCNPMLEKTAKVYIDAFEAITGQVFVPDASGATPLDRIRTNLTPFFTT